ncbi:uncharacterized protein ATNIH1004_010852 [Aspergillus tanneri]|uniref:Uncharacterized protein n=1 Tax=Aspergillus tanneri TaxID=1220188 RepID=A0A5M9MAG6_9EURO|nr:uncharacterized protein ATNIH1004_010852 [Aspergillus tanneri]KAA8641913.1 hypothetical protein ATNIH1004_010852 [Aspergillus tanneri]
MHMEQQVLVCTPFNLPQSMASLLSLLAVLVIQTLYGFTAQHRDDSVVEEIKAAVPDIKYVFDTIGNQTSSVITSKSIQGEGYLCTVRRGKAHTENVAPEIHVTDVLVWTAFLKELNYWKFHWPHDHELASEQFEKLPGWLDDAP